MVTVDTASRDTSVADPDPVLFYPLDPGSGSGMNFFRIPDLGSRLRPLFWWHFLTISSESMLCYLYNTGLLQKLTHKTINSMKKLCFLLLPLFLHRTRIRDPRSGMNKYSDPDPGSGIKHPGSATLRDTMPLKSYIILPKKWTYSISPFLRLSARCKISSICKRERRI
jgi:hypothetical protein